jgi:quercetin dioxygenase-like cupin family protein
MTTPFVRNAGDQDRCWFYGGGLHTWLAHDEQTDSAYLLFEAAMEGGKCTPLHTHPDADETFYLLDGSLLLHVDGTEHELRAGGIAMVPRGVPHAFLVTSADARMLCLHTPGGGEQFYQHASVPAAEGSSPVEVDFGRIAEAAEASGSMKVVGPPPFAAPVLS